MKLFNLRWAIVMWLLGKPTSIMYGCKINAPIGTTFRSDANRLIVKCDIRAEQPRPVDSIDELLQGITAKRPQ